MNITTKYNVGDTVYYGESRRIHRVTVQSVSANTSQGDLRISYYIHPGGMSVDESRVHPTAFSVYALINTDLLAEVERFSK